MPNRIKRLHADAFFTSFSDISEKEFVEVLNDWYIKIKTKRRFLQSAILKQLRTGNLTPISHDDIINIEFLTGKFKLLNKIKQDYEKNDFVVIKDNPFLNINNDGTITTKIYRDTFSKSNQ